MVNINRQTFRFNLIKQHLSKMVLWIIMIYVVASNLSYKLWNEEGRIIADDIISYYQYLPATFIYKDLSFAFSKSDPQYFSNKIWVKRTVTGRYVGKMTMGLAIMYSPFFLTSNLLADPLGYPPDGYSLPYRLGLVIANIFYLGVGLYFLRKVLKKYFSDSVVSITLIAIALGTNLYFYSVFTPGMPHTFNFCLFAVFIFLMITWLDRPSYGISILLGFIVGLIILIRPSNAIILLLIILWGVNTWTRLVDRFRFFLQNWSKVLLASACIVLILIPQLLFWNYSTGHYLYYSYGNEGFFFNHPRIADGFFSYRKGWLIYTPIMTFALLGLIMLFIRRRSLFWPVFTFVVLNVYLILSWWSWWYGGSFGQRAMIESYAILAIPFAALTEWILSKRWYIYTIYFVLCAFFIFLNLFQSKEYYNGAIHWDSMSKAAYWDSFLRLRPSDRFQDLLDHPDYDKAMVGLNESIRVPSPIIQQPDTLKRAEYIRKVEWQIRNDSAWYKEIRQKAAKWNQPVDSVIHNDAIWLWKQKEKEQ